MQSIINFFNNFSHTLTTIITIVASIYTIGKYCILKPLRGLIQTENKTTNERLTAIETELKTNDGSSLRDAINEIIKEQKVLLSEQQVMKNQIQRLENRRKPGRKRASYNNHKE